MDIRRTKMSRLTKWAMIPAIALALVLTTDTSQATAGGFSISIGSGGFGPSGVGYSGARYGSGYRGYSSYRGYGGFNHGYRGPAPIVYPGVSPRYGVGYGGYVRPPYDCLSPALVPQRGYNPYRSSRYGFPY
ncbi:unnamed protein product [Hapterophycus canaliculatus]